MNAPKSQPADPVLAALDNAETLDAAEALTPDQIEKVEKALTAFRESSTSGRFFVP